MSSLDRHNPKKRDGRAVLTEQFRTLLLASFPHAKITETASLQFHIDIAGREMTLFLDNLYRHIGRLNPAEADVEIARHLNAMIAEAQTPEKAFSKEQIIPTIKDQLYLDQAGDKVPLVKEHLAADLWIVYAVDFPTRIATFKPEKLDELGVKPDSLRSLALENLKRILPPVEIRGDGAWFLVTAGGDYTSSLLLLDEVWEELQTHVEGDLVVAVPTRDVLLVTGTASSAGITAVRARALELEQGGSYAITQTLLRRRGSHWATLS